VFVGKEIPLMLWRELLASIEGHSSEALWGFRMTSGVMTLSFNSGFCLCVADPGDLPYTTTASREAQLCIKKCLTRNQMVPYSEIGN
jgi:hypothetical protein